MLVAGITFLVPLVITFGIASFWVLYAVLIARQPLLGDWMALRVQVSVFVALITMHPTLTKTVFQCFQCDDVIFGKSLLVADANIFCWEQGHWELIAKLAVPATLVYVLGIPAIIGAALYSARDSLTSADTMLRLGFV